MFENQLLVTASKEYGCNTMHFKRPWTFWPLAKRGTYKECWFIHQDQRNPQLFFGNCVYERYVTHVDFPPSFCHKITLHTKPYLEYFKAHLLKDLFSTALLLHKLLLDLEKFQVFSDFGYYYVHILNAHTRNWHIFACHLIIDLWFK